MDVIDYKIQDLTTSDIFDNKLEVIEHIRLAHGNDIDYHQISQYYHEYLDYASVNSDTLTMKDYFKFYEHVLENYIEYSKYINYDSIINKKFVELLVSFLPAEKITDISPVQKILMSTHLFLKTFKENIAVFARTNFVEALLETYKEGNSLLFPILADLFSLFLKSGYKESIAPIMDEFLSRSNDQAYNSFKTRNQFAAIKFISSSVNNAPEMCADKLDNIIDVIKVVLPSIGPIKSVSKLLLSFSMTFPDNISEFLDIDVLNIIYSHIQTKALANVSSPYLLSFIKYVVSINIETAAIVISSFPFDIFRTFLVGYPKSGEVSFDLLEMMIQIDNSILSKILTENILENLIENYSNSQYIFPKKTAHFLGFILQYLDGKAQIEIISTQIYLDSLINVINFEESLVNYFFTSLYNVFATCITNPVLYGQLISIFRNEGYSNVLDMTNDTWSEETLGIIEAICEAISPDSQET